MNTQAETIPHARPRRLFLSMIPDDFDPQADIAAGPWCFLYAEDVCDGWQDLPFPEPFSISDDIVAEDARTRRLANYLCGVWAERMNQRHDRSYSRGYWRTLLIMWMVTAVQALWSRYRRIELLVERHRDEKILVQIFEDVESWHFPSLHEFNNNLNFNNGFDLWMSSILLHTIAPAHWQIEAVLPPATDGRVTSETLAKPRSRLAGKVFRKIMPRLSFESAYGVRLGKVLLSLYLNILPKKQNARHHFSFDDDAIIGEFPKNFLTILDRFLETTLPETYGQNFPLLEHKGLRVKYFPGRVFIDSLGAQVDAKRIVLAHAFENGEKLVCNQHGSSYGTNRSLSRASEADYKYHAMLTWGWNEQEDLEGNFVPLPSPLLSGYRDRHRFEKETMVFVSSPIDVRGHRLNDAPTPSQWLEYRRLKLSFIDVLAARCRDRLLYRPYVRVVARLRDQEIITARWPAIPILEGDLHAELLCCRLLALDNPGTTLNIAMAANIPTVCYWPPEYWEMTRPAKPYFNALRECGILHDSPESAARYINKIWDDLPQWWSSPDVQAARRSWADRYARTSRFWWLDWMRALAKL